MAAASADALADEVGALAAAPPPAAAWDAAAAGGGIGLLPTLGKGALSCFVASLSISASKFCSSASALSEDSEANTCKQQAAAPAAKYLESL